MSSFEKMLTNLNSKVESIKTGLRQKNSDDNDETVKVPEIKIHEINSFGLVHLIFSTEMYSRLKNETGDIH